jgi:hypothetical protein
MNPCVLAGLARNIKTVVEKNKMIDKTTLKKHNLKAVPFSCIGEGQTFYDWVSIIGHPADLTFYERRLQDNDIFFADGGATCNSPAGYVGHTVYVPVWRVC